MWWTRCRETPGRSAAGRWSVRCCTATTKFCVVAADRGGARQVGELLGGGQLLQGSLHPGKGVAVVDGGRPGAEQGAPGAGLVVDQEGAGPAGGGRPGGGQTGRTGADDQHVGVHVPVVVEDVFVVTRVEHALAAEVLGLEPLADADGGGREHRLVDLSRPGAAHPQQSIGLLETGGQHAARAAEVEGGPAAGAPGGEQGAGDGVALVARELGAVDADGDLAVTVDAVPRGAGGIQAGGGHGCTPSCVEDAEDAAASEGAPGRRAGLDVPAG